MVILIGKVWLFILKEDWNKVLIVFGLIFLVGLISLNILVLICFCFICLLKLFWKCLLMVFSKLFFVFCFKLLLILEKWFILISVMV